MFLRPIIKCTAVLIIIWGSCLHLWHDYIHVISVIVKSLIRRYVLCPYLQDPWPHLLQQTRDIDVFYTRYIWLRNSCMIYIVKSGAQLCRCGRPPFCRLAKHFINYTKCNRKNIVFNGKMMYVVGTIRKSVVCD